MEPQPPSPGGSRGAPEDDIDVVECECEIALEAGSGSSALGNRDGDSPGTQRVQPANAFILMMSRRGDSTGEPLAMATICRERAQRRASLSPAQQEETVVSGEDRQSQLKRARTTNKKRERAHEKDPRNA